MMGYSLHAFLVSCALLAMVAAVYDLRSRRIPNWLSALGVLGGVVGHAAMGYAAAGGDFALRAAGYSLLGAVVVGAVPLVLWRFGAVGGGDVKIIMAVGAVCHASIGMTLVFFALSLTACFGVIKLAWDGHLLRSVATSLLALANPLRARRDRVAVAEGAREPLRFGPALVLSAIAIVLTHGGLR